MRIKGKDGYCVKLLNLLASSMLAGVCISIGGLVFLKNPGITGAVLFSFGLLTVVHFKFLLYTGTAGFCYSVKDLGRLCLILAGNVIGCFLVAQAFRLCVSPDLAAAVIQNRLSASFLQALILGTGCGFIMTAAVKFAREGKFLPLLFGVPCFIMCGFYHSIADAFYYCMDLHPEAITPWLGAVLGNFIGCNLYRLRQEDINT